MTPQREKAIKLVEKYKNHSTIWIDEKECYTSPKKAKEAALICVDEILKEVPTEILDTYKFETNFVINERYNFWQKVKEEINKL